MKAFTRSAIGGLVLASLIFADSTVVADPGDPVAIRHLPNGGFAIESMWNLSVVISHGEQESAAIGGVDILRPGVERNDTGTASDRFIVDCDADLPIDHVLDRVPNEPKPSWRPYSKTGTLSDNAIRVQVSDGGDTITVDVDGVRITLLSVAGTFELAGHSAQVTRSDVLVLSTDSPENDPMDQVQALSGKPEGPHTIVVGTRAERFEGGNTMAVSKRKNESSGADQPAARQMVLLSTRPIELDPPLRTLIDNKESACEASQRLFADLSVRQMNFRPANGTHTPRWNAEHMMGRELLFFSQIFHAKDSNIPVIDLNPAQMPPDYEARHADWTGEEEARQMERVSAFTRRFAYLLDDVPMNEPAPGSRWTLRGLLLQMERHYNEHTANVKKKFELEGWPE